MTIDALIFDVDGTLADTEEAHRLAFNTAFERLGLPWNWTQTRYRELLQVTGGKERLAADLQTRQLSAAEFKRQHAMIAQIHALKTQVYTEAVRNGSVPLRPGVERLLQEALNAGYLLGIATTTTAANIDALLSANLGTSSLQMFNVIACGDQVLHKKPAPDIYQLALRHLGVSPHRTVAFEDSQHGLRAAQGASLWTVVTPTFWTAGSDFSGAGLVLPSLGDPHAPLAMEPGGVLRLRAWLTLDELEARFDDAATSLTHVRHDSISV